MFWVSPSLIPQQLFPWVGGGGEGAVQEQATLPGEGPLRGGGGAAARNTAHRQGGVPVPGGAALPRHGLDGRVGGAASRWHRV